jgi:hypothetical protein
MKSYIVDYYEVIANSYEVITNSYEVIFLTLAIMLPISFLLLLNQVCNTNTQKLNFSSDVKEIVEEEVVDEIDEIDENDYESNSEDDASTIDNDEKYTSVIQKAFTLITRRQLLSITGRKYISEKKEKLVVIAMYKFLLTSVEKSDKLTKGIKLFVESNKEMLKKELLELYEVDN